MHLDLQNAAALTGFAAAALDVEAEPPGTVATHFGVLRVGKQRADIPEHAGVGGRVGARRAPDGRLVNANDLVHPLHALNGFALARTAAGTVQRGGQRFVQNFIDQRRFARAGHTGYADHFAQRKIYGNILQIVFVCLDDPQKLAIAGAARFGYFDILAA